MKKEEKMKKRLLAWMLAGIMTASALAGCGNAKNNGQAGDVASEAETVEGEGGLQRLLGQQKAEKGKKQSLPFGTVLLALTGKRWKL